MGDANRVFYILRERRPGKIGRYKRMPEAERSGRQTAAPVMKLDNERSIHLLILSNPFTSCAYRQSQQVFLISSPFNYIQVPNPSFFGVLYLRANISKAFDRIWYKSLLAKLPMFGLHHTLINWIGSFLSDRSIAVRVDGFLSNLHSIDAGVPQDSVISPVLFILFINDLLTSTSSSIHSFADDTFLSSSFSFNPNDHASTDIQLHRNISASLLSNDLTVIEKWGKDNLVSFNQSKTKQAVISRKRNQNFPAVLMNGDELDTSASFTQLGLSLSSNLTLKTHIHSLAKHASQKLGFLARARGFFSSSHLLSIYKSQIRPSLEYCSHVWGGAPKSTLCLLDKVQSKAIRLINNPNLTKSLQPLSHRRLVGDLSIYDRYFNGHCSQEIRDIIPVPLRRVRTTRSSTPSHPFQI